ncbi:acetate--CoA ligase [Albimonas sp. CAU 1670]|uniref:acetate--CoA ligase n=1 Tax=Albimonas sp. CAU 1670 TaxID=3032599 RepID=UPI0023DABD5A|nr:acetate--CoA ligase [Albimonas sp. CAU 1670]MDF2234833.1 acetate--CoA ligase [Albimonas sp. CAU 1670]
MDDRSAERSVAPWSGEGVAADAPDGFVNIAWEAVDRHVRDGFGTERAMLWLGKDGGRLAFSYADLAEASSRFANVLAARGIERGDGVFALMGRTPELYVAALGALKAGLVFTPLFSAFGPDPIRTRMEIGDARVLVTTAPLYLRKIADWIHALPSLKLVLIVGEDAPEGCVALAPAMRGASAAFETVRTGPEDPALIHFTSGTTGKPKGVVHVHDAVRYHAFSGREALDLRPGAIYWCTADPGWVTGTSYGIVAPLVNRARMIVDEAEFDLERWYATIAREKVEVWYTAPTAIRMMMRSGEAAAKAWDLSSLRFLASVGEPLNPEAVIWSQKAFGQPFHDNWWQTETGGIMIANRPGMAVKPGSMGRPMPGIDAAVVEHRGEAVALLGDDEVGELALRPGWPSMMRGYLHEEARFRKAFADGWYLSGDLVRRDAEGYFWFVGRADDLIKTSGHLVGPFEVENALIEHEAVAEAGVIGVPDETAGEVVKAYVTLNPGFEPGEALEREIRGHARKRLGPAVAPREVVFRRSLPKTRSGKIMRRLLKARELGSPEGDISTLETDET